MILYELVCENDHSFEAWFRDSGSYDDQVRLGEVSCPLCGTLDVRKALMAPRLARRKGQDDALRPGREAAPTTERTPAINVDGGAAGTAVAETAASGGVDFTTKMRQALHELRRQVESHCDYVGDRFADEARKIHNGESETRPIYGETTREEAQDLKDEGVEFVSVPWLKSDG